MTLIFTIKVFGWLVSIQSIMYQSQHKMPKPGLKQKYDPRLSQIKRELHDFGDPDLRKEIDQLLRMEEDFDRMKSQDYKADPRSIRDLVAIQARLDGAISRLNQPFPLTQIEARQIDQAFRLARGTMIHEEMGVDIYKLAQRERQVDRMKDEISCFREYGEEMRQTLKQKKKEKEDLMLKEQTEKGLIRRYCRIKPAKITDQRCYSLFEIDPDLITVQVIKELSNFKSTFSIGKTLKFDKIFNQDTSQAQVFGSFEQSIQVALNGMPFCLFAYGQTNSGKTHTIFGGEGSYEGICPRVIRKIFAVLEEESEGKPNVRIGVQEITKDGRMDMINNKALKFAKQKFIPLSSQQQAIETVKHYSALRKTSATTGNMSSSRSHMIITFNTIKQIGSDQLYGSISLVDLAGSEKLGTSQDDSESTFINRSLQKLKNRIMQLSNNFVVPSCSQPLIQALDLYLKKNSSITTTIINISSLKQNASESKRSIEFAQMIGKVKKIEVQSKPPKKL